MHATTRTAPARDSRGRFLPRAAAPAAAPVATVTADVTPAPVLVVGIDRVDPVVALRREVLAPAVAPCGATPALVREVGRAPATRLGAGWTQRHPWATSWVAGAALVVPVIALGAWLHGWM